MLRAALIAILACSADAAIACGVCVEDKMAAVYDHAVVTRALGQKHHIAFFHIDGPLVAGNATRQTLVKAAEAAADRDSARVSVESASLAVAFDPRRTSVARLQKELDRRLAGIKLSLVLMQVLEHPSDVNPSITRALRAVGK